MLINKNGDTKISWEELLYLYLCNLIEYEEYIDVLYSLAEVDENVINLMVEHEVEKGYKQVEQYMNYHAKALNRELLTAKTIVILNEKYPFIDYGNLKKVDEYYPLPFYIPYFLYGVDVEVIRDINGKVLINTTGNREEDMKQVISYYEKLVM